MDILWCEHCHCIQPTLNKCQPDREEYGIEGSLRKTRYTVKELLFAETHVVNELVAGLFSEPILKCNENELNCPGRKHGCGVAITFRCAVELAVSGSLF